MLDRVASFVLLVFFVNLPALAQKQITIQPGPDCGKDAMIWYLETPSPIYGNTNETNYGNSYLPLMEWTWGGIPGRRWLLIDFRELALFPKETNIQDARLSLYFRPDTGDGDHSTPAITGLSHIGLIQRITSPWQEMEVSWNTQPSSTTDSQVSIDAPQNTTQHYEDIDITGLISTIVASPEENFGLLLKLEDPNYYQKLILASSDDQDSTLWPKLTITYSEETELFSYEEALTGTECYEEEMEEQCAIGFPNIFTPNGDGINEQYGMITTNSCEFEAFHLMIYNRWGELVFESNDESIQWDGTYNGRTAPTEAYFYQAEYQLIDGSIEQKQGSLHLIR